jgi:DNA polymerase III delta prime subunit
MGGRRLGRFRYAGRTAMVERVVRQVEAGQIGQPFLFTGPSGSGKEATALEIARRVNCVAADVCTAERPCESCAKAVTFQHPDIRWIGPAPATIDEKAVACLLAAKADNPFYQADFAATSQVLIGDPEDPGPLTIRALNQFLRRQAFQGRWKVAVVADAHRLNAAAANAFLKTLEEPSPGALIMLTTASTAGMLPTILSRCQRLAFEPLGEAELVEVLRRVAPQQAADAPAAARLADGNARRAMALLGPEAQAMWAWTARVFASLAEGRRGEALAASEHLNAGLLPSGDGWDETKDLGQKRQRALLFCEMLAQLYGETVACRERSQQWRPRAPEVQDVVRRMAAARPTESLLADLHRVDSARIEVDGNLNIGLCTAALLQDLSDHGRSDR